MPLAPMGCKVQVHKKMDKRGMWVYHSLDGWYLNTSPEHYRVHNCHIKSTKAEQLMDTIQFKHKHITNPTVSHSDKIMNALANCKAALMGKIDNKSDHSLEEVKTIVQQPTRHYETTISKGGHRAISSKGGINHKHRSKVSLNHHPTQYHNLQGKQHYIAQLSTTDNRKIISHRSIYRHNHQHAAQDQE
ncbi:hypothetical protein ACHAW6_009233 [Cyclotella cf. meneghiniana]